MGRVFRAAILTTTFVGFVSLSSLGFSQDMVVRGDGSFEACASDMEKVPGDAYDSCASFVKQAHVGDSQNVQKAKDCWR